MGKLDALPLLVFVVDQDVRIQEYKATASFFLMAEKMFIHNRRAGEIMHCVHSNEVEEGCGSISVLQGLHYQGFRHGSLSGEAMSFAGEQELNLSGMQTR